MAKTHQFFFFHWRDFPLLPILLTEQKVRENHQDKCTPFEDFPSVPVPATWKNVNFLSLLVAL